MLRLDEMPFNKVAPMIRALGKAGMGENLVALLRKEDNAAKAVALLSREFFPETEDALEEATTAPFRYSAEEQVASVLRWNQEFEGEFTNEQIHAMRDIAPHTVLRPFETIVLVPYLDTVEATMEFWMKVLKDTHPRFWWWEVLESDEKHLRLLEACKPFPANILRWERIDLGAHWNGKDDNTDPKSVRGADSPHFGVYAALAHNPNYAATMNGTSRPYLWVPGLEVTVDGSGRWTYSPSCETYSPGGDLHSVSRKLYAYAHWSDSRDVRSSVPVLREVWS